MAINFTKQLVHGFRFSSIEVSEKLELLSELFPCSSIQNSIDDLIQLKVSTNCALFWLTKDRLKCNFIFHLYVCVDRKTPALSIVTALHRTSQTPGTGASNVCPRSAETLGQIVKVNVYKFA